MRVLVIRSFIGVRPETFWGEQSVATVNHELGPWIRMTAPPAWRDLKLKDWNGRGELPKSWVLLLGLLPLDRHAFGSIDSTQSMRFVETSSSWINRVWRHERAALVVPGGCEVVDTVGFAPRLSQLSPLLKAVYIFVFRHRHARLRALHAMSDG